MVNAASRSLTRVWPIVLLIVVLAFGFTVWPSPYRYEHSGDRLIRINRITGKSWEYVEHGIWVSGKGELDGVASPDPNKIDTGAAMAPVPAAMDTSIHDILDLYAKPKRDSISRRR